MTRHRRDAIDHTVPLSHDWVDELRDRLGWSSSRDTTRLLGAVLAELREQLPGEAAACLAAAMPLLVRGMFFEGWHPGRAPAPRRDADAFARAVTRRLGRMRAYRGRADIAQVFAMLANRVAEAELRPVRDALPPAIRALWPAETADPAG